MKKNILAITVIIVAILILTHHPKAHWQGQLAPDDPIQTEDHLPISWLYKDFIIKPRANYHMKAVILSKHHYWGNFETEDTLAKYDLALGWGPMSDARVIDQLDISQSFRWYHYHWHDNPPIDPAVIVAHSSNNHIIAADQDVLDNVASFKLYDVVVLDGYLVDVQDMKNGWSWHTSLSRTDTGGGACELFWVTRAYSQ